MQLSRPDVLTSGFPFIPMRLWCFPLAFVLVLPTTIMTGMIMHLVLTILDVDISGLIVYIVTLYISMTQT